MLKKLYDEGEERIEKEISIDYIMREVRKLKLAADKKLTCEDKFLIDHASENVICLDEVEEELEFVKVNRSEPEDKEVKRDDWKMV